MSTNTEKPAPAKEERGSSSLEVFSEKEGVVQLVPTDFKSMYSQAQYIANSDLVPKDYKGKPENVIIAIQLGAEVGLKPIQSVQSIAIINGRPSIWGDAILGIVQSSGLLEYIHESIEEIDGHLTARCETKRKGYPKPHITFFSQEDAEQAGLWNKVGPWKQYSKRMLQMRSRGFNLRDQYSDVLKGLISREEALDIPKQKIDFPEYEPKEIENNATIREVEEQQLSQGQTQLEIPDDKFTKPEEEQTLDTSQINLTPKEINTIQSQIIKFQRKAEAFNEFLKEKLGIETLKQAKRYQIEEILQWITQD